MYRCPNDRSCMCPCLYLSRKQVRCLLAYVGGAESSRDRVSEPLMNAWDIFGVAALRQLEEDSLLLAFLLDNEAEMKEGYLLRPDLNGLEQGNFLTPWQVQCTNPGD